MLFRYRFYNDKVPSASTSLKGVFATKYCHYLVNIFPNVQYNYTEALLVASSTFFTTITDETSIVETQSLCLIEKL